MLHQFDTHHVCNNNTYPPSHTKPIDSDLKCSKEPPLSPKQSRKTLNLLQKMASFALFITLSFSLLLSPFFLQVVLAQVPSTCASRLLSLAPCGPFVQGFVQLPAQPCCDSLNQIYSQEATCLCLLLNNTSTLSPAFPINQTLALQLPPLCNIPANSSSCSSSSSSHGT